MTDLRRKRIVYMSDQEWAEVRKLGTNSERSASAVIRDALEATRLVDVVADGKGAVTIYPTGTPDAVGRPASDLERRAMAWATGSPASFVPEFNPVPKPGAKKR